MSRYTIAALFVLMTVKLTPAALHIDATCGYSLASKFRYVADFPAAGSIPYLTFDPINNVCASSRLTIDIWKDCFRLGVLGGFMRRYELTMHDADASRKVGGMLSIPIIGFLEGHSNHLMYEFGLGPFITRVNYTDPQLPPYGVTSLFGFLFGVGYERDILPRLAICARGELLVNAPVFVVDIIDPALRRQIKQSRYPEYNMNEYQTIIFAATVSCGLRYEFGKNIRIPLDDGVKTLGTRVLPKIRERAGKRR